MTTGLRSGGSVVVRLATAVAVLSGAALFGYLSAAPSGSPQAGSPGEALPRFEAALDELRRSHEIPGMSAAIASSGAIVWSRGFGQADLATGSPAGPDTAYHLASLTKPYAAVVMMQLVEQGLVDLDDPVSRYGIELQSEGTIRLRHLLNHTSHGVPGDAYRYNGARFGQVGAVFEVAAGRSFGELLVEVILRPLGLEETSPSIYHPAFALTDLDPDAYRATIATPYAVTDSGPVRSAYQHGFSPAAGMFGSAEDMARFSIAIDEHRLLTPETTRLMFTPAVSNAGETLPYAIGWFVTPVRGVELQWHYGWWDATSTLIVRAPEKGLVFVVMANTDAMSRRHRRLGDGELLDSPFASLFLETFVFGSAPIAADRQWTSS